LLSDKKPEVTTTAATTTAATTKKESVTTKAPIPADAPAFVTGTTPVGYEPHWDREPVGQNSNGHYVYEMDQYGNLAPDGNNGKRGVYAYRSDGFLIRVPGSQDIKRGLE
jgi:hypothetical protein